MSYCMGAMPDPEQTRPTLVLTNKSLLRTWRQDRNKFFGPSLKVLIFFKMDCKKNFKTITFQEWCQYDVIVTTYDVVQSEAVRAKILPKSKRDKQLSLTYLNEYVFREDASARGPALLYRTEFHRILADESHRFANYKTKLFYAVCLLKSKRKSCLTGTGFLFWCVLVVSFGHVVGFFFCRHTHSQRGSRHVVTVTVLQHEHHQSSQTMVHRSVQNVAFGRQCHDHDVCKGRCYIASPDQTRCIYHIGKRRTGNIRIVLAVAKTHLDKFQKQDWTIVLFSSSFHFVATKTGFFFIHHSFSYTTVFDRSALRHLW